MKHLRTLSLIAVASAALLALFAAGTASATTFQSGGKNLPAGTEIIMTLKAGTSSVFKDTSGFTVETCTQSESRSKTSNETGASITAIPISQTTGGCSHTAHVLKLGEMKFEWTSGNNGKVFGVKNEYTYKSTVFGISCVVATSTATPAGTFTGTTSGNATMDVNGVFSSNFCGDAVWTATYTVTSPTPLALVN